jgi:pyruvate formate lyase activating enzyme
MKKQAILYKPLKDDVVQCRLCAHYCRIEAGELGFCRVRKNEAGGLVTLAYGETIARHVDPIEKKPLYHFLPGSLSYSIATAGCNFHCGFCQNWQISQAAPEQDIISDGRPFLPGQVAAEAEKAGCAGIAYTYTEPTIFFEYARDTAIEAKKIGLKNIFVTNGFMSRQALAEAAGWLDAANVDLKAWSDDYYRKVCAGRLKPVLDTITNMKRMGIWVEVTTLVIPGDNDGDDQLKGIAGFIAETGRDIPWHISRFHPDYRYGTYQPTPLETMEKAKTFGHRAGLKYVYLGNIGGEKDTFCPACGETVIRRSAAGTTVSNLSRGACARCGEPIEGVWE